MGSPSGAQYYWRRFLLPEERLVHVFGVSRAYLALFWWLPLAILLAAALWLAVGGVPAIGLLLFLAVGGASLPPLYLTYFIRYAITDRRVMSREGLLKKDFVAVDLSSITDITIKERLLERIITHSGNVLINTAGSSGIELTLQHAARPFDRRQDIFRHRQEAAASVQKGTGS